MANIANLYEGLTLSERLQAIGAQIKQHPGGFRVKLNVPGKGDQTFCFEFSTRTWTALNNGTPHLVDGLVFHQVLDEAGAALTIQ